MNSLPQANSPAVPVELAGAAPALNARSCLFLDIDGTLLEIVDRPDAVRVDPELRRLLRALHGATQGALALISGRPVAEIDTLFGSSRFCVAGQHGAERRDSVGRVHRHRPPRAGLGLAEAERQLRHLVAAYPELVLEDKGINLALHYRRAPGLVGIVREAIEGLVVSLGAEFEMQAGKMVFEIKPSRVDKGTAIAEFMQEAPFRGRTPVFVGDDLTDESGFALVNRLGGVAIKVGDGPSAARCRLAHAGAVRAWLEEFVRMWRSAGRVQS